MIIFFMVWVGKLIKELNEILIIVNIKQENLEIFNNLLKKKFILIGLNNLMKRQN